MPTTNQFTRQSLIALVDRALDVLTAAAAIPLFFLTYPIFSPEKIEGTPEPRSRALRLRGRLPAEKRTMRPVRRVEWQAKEGRPRAEVSVLLG